MNGFMQIESRTGQLVGYHLFESNFGLPSHMRHEGEDEDLSALRLSALLYALYCNAGEDGLTVAEVGTTRLHFDRHLSTRSILIYSVDQRISRDVATVLGQSLAAELDKLAQPAQSGSATPRRRAPSKRAAVAALAALPRLLAAQLLHDAAGGCPWVFVAYSPQFVETAQQDDHKAVGAVATGPIAQRPRSKSIGDLSLFPAKGTTTAATPAAPSLGPQKFVLTATGAPLTDQAIDALSTATLSAGKALSSVLGIQDSLSQVEFVLAAPKNMRVIVLRQNSLLLGLPIPSDIPAGNLRSDVRQCMSPLELAMHIAHELNIPV
eukprot:TRINITY_DN3455_c0_g1_i1.p1 TRINITY_DN3455_c0_g1~~TRINITY_DN3455_c0_g1_i1.p1  ORF type:complete len:322 (+),score=83.17 TRINITY_DN3455_c0_g1_i1:128-1093(+)